MNSLIMRRIFAYLVDYALLFGVLIPAQVALYAFSGGFPYRWLQTGPQVEAWVLLSVSLPCWLYFSLLESSSMQATLGKRLFRLRVGEAATFARISYPRALLRTAVKLLPWELTHFTVLLPTPMWGSADPGFRFGLVVVYLLLGMYLVVMFLNPSRRSVDDWAAGTVVL